MRAKLRRMFQTAWCAVDALSWREIAFLVGLGLIAAGALAITKSGRFAMVVSGSALVFYAALRR